MLVESGELGENISKNFNSDFECGSTGDVTAVSRSNVEPVSLTFILQNVKHMQRRLRQAIRLLTWNFEVLTGKLCNPVSPTIVPRSN